MNMFIQQVAYERSPYYEYMWEVVVMRDGEIIETKDFTDYRMAAEWMRLRARKA